MRKVPAPEPVLVDAWTIFGQGDVFAGSSSCLVPLDVERYLDAKPKNYQFDPFASWLYRTSNPSKFEVGQPPITHVVERSLKDPWADFFAGKGPRPIKLGPDDILPREPTRDFDPNVDDILTLGAFVSGNTATDTDAFSSGWIGGDMFSSRPPKKRRGYFRVRPWPASRLPGGQKPGPLIAEKGIAGQAHVLPEPRWPNTNLPLRVYISSTVAAARGGLISHEIKSALREWREASNGKLLYVLTDQYVEADIVFVCEMTTDHQWAENLTDYHNSNYDRVRVRLIDDTLLKLDPKRVRGLCLHEVGHAFGIRNHSSDKRDAMSLAATDDFHPVLGLSNNDKKLIAKLYP